MSGYSIRDIETAVAARYRLTRDQMRGREPARAMARPRQIAHLMAADARIAAEVEGCRELIARTEPCENERGRRRSRDGAGEKSDAARALTQTFSVTNFEKFQHYRDRSPPWIKLYNGLLDDYGFAQLPDASKLHLVAIWLLASRFDNRVPHDPGWIARRINASERVDLSLLQARGFITVNDGSAPLADCGQDAEPESETETEQKEKKRRNSSADADAPLPVKSGKKTYPADFETFWRDYPTDPLMSKLKAYEKWRRLPAADRAAACAALPGFRAHCGRDPTYRPVHAERFLSQRRFDGFNEKAKTKWGEPRRRKMRGCAPNGAAMRNNWWKRSGRRNSRPGFLAARFDAGPPVTITVEKPFAASGSRAITTAICGGCSERLGGGGGQ